ncbi:acetyl-hydrolase, putative [Rhodobacteraceae bacterium HTCC2083]|nr:acetyl-hydrolase, putative [Rhodobacteraceae bacterium HTCC2083]
MRVTPNVLKENTSGEQNVCILYFHGGAYTVGSPRANENDARRLAMSCAATVISVKYTTAINAPYPAAVDDVEAAYEALCASGVAANKIVLAGTSAGEGLVLALLHRLLGQQRTMPVCVVTLSPWLDLSMSYPSLDALSAQDVILSRAWTTRAAKMYAGQTAINTPEISPVHGRFESAPPTLVLYSKVEIFRDEIESFSNVLERFGVEAEFYAHNFAPHAWPMVVDDAPETEAAFSLIAQFVSKHTT